MAKTPGKREISSEAKKELIITKSLELFRQYGYEKITISDICEECKINVGTLYHHFGSKMGILQAISDQISVASAFSEIDSELVKKPSDAIMQFFLNYANRWKMLGADLTTQIFIYFQKIYINPYTYTLKDSEAINSLSRFIKSSQDAGYFDPTAEPMKTANMIMLIGRGVVYDWCMQNGNYDLSARALEVMGLIDFFVRGDSGSNSIV
jgi:Transcriptional regulator